jgi:HPt (histidine-containing phosphotransfer) domain-containing protein
MASFFYFYQDYKLNKKVSNLYLNLIYKVDLSSINEDLYKNNEKKIEEKINNIFSNPLIKSIQIIKTNENKPFIKKGVVPIFGLFIKKDFPLFYVFKKQGIEKARKIGTITIWIILKNNFIFFLIIQLFQIILLSFFIFLFFKFKFINPLNSLSQFVQELGSNKVQENIFFLNRKGHIEKDEFDTFLTNLNHTKFKISGQQEKFKNYAERISTIEKVILVGVLEQKNKLQSILDNIKEGIFTVDVKGEIISPVSKYNDQIFEENIIGKSIFETLYKDIDKSSETFSNIKSVFATIFNKNRDQFGMAHYFLPKKIEYRIYDPQSKQFKRKNLNIGFNAIWDENGLLTHIIYLIEDITEKETLTNQIKIKSEINEKNIFLITEMLKFSSDEISSFLQDSLKAIHAIVKIEDINLIKHKKDIFRHLHTIKGHARSFNFFILSNFIHITEGKCKNLFEKNQMGHSFTSLSGEINDFHSNLYLIVQEINKYINLAEKIFQIKDISKEESSLKLIDHLTDIENIMTYQFGFPLYLLSSKIPKKSKLPLFQQIQKCPPSKDMIPEINNIIDKMTKTYHSFSYLQENIETLFKFKKFVKTFYKIQMKDQEKFSKDLIDNFLFLKKDVYLFFLKENKSQDHFLYKNYISLFQDLLKMTILLNFENPKNNLNNTAIKKICSQFISKSHETKNNFFIKMGEDLKNTLSRTQHKNAPPFFLESIFSHLWSFFGFISKLEMSTIDSRDQEIFLETFNKIEMTAIKDHDLAKTFILDIIPTLKNGLIFQFLKVTIKEKVSLITFFELSKRLIPQCKSNLFEGFFFNHSTSINIKKVLKTIEKHDFFAPPGFELKPLMSQKNSLAMTIYSFLNDIPYYDFLKFSEIYKFLQVFTLKEQISGQFYLKTKTIPVVAKIIDDLELLAHRNETILLKKTIKKLRHHPIIPGLNKLKAMAFEIADKLDKAIDIHMNIPDITMEKGIFNDFQEILIQLLRNAIDHGIESPQERIDLGKQAQGVIEISCTENKDGNLYFTFLDNGRGIDSKSLCSKALEQGFLSQNELNSLDEQKKIDLIFLPFLSLKTSFDDISGQGIGMDIVKKNIEKLGGTIQVHSIKGESTEFFIILP